MISGVPIGFRLGFDPSTVSLNSATQNMLSASFHPSVIDHYLLTELLKGRAAGLYLISGLYISNSKPTCQSLWSDPKRIPTWKVAAYLGFN